MVVHRAKLRQAARALWPEPFEVYVVNLNPAIGAEMKKRRPCVILSPKEMNEFLQTVIIAPMTTKTHKYPCRVGVSFGGKTGEVALDQMRTIDQSRLVRKLGKLTGAESEAILAVLQEMFAG